MWRRVSIFVLLSFAALAVVIGNAQTSDDSKPASTNVGGAQYPRVWPDGRVTFRVSAPAAQKVAIEPLNGPSAPPAAAGAGSANRAGQGGPPAGGGGQGSNGLGGAPFEMTKGSDGYWMVTTPPAVPGQKRVPSGFNGASTFAIVVTGVRHKIFSAFGSIDTR